MYVVYFVTPNDSGHLGAMRSGSPPWRSVGSRGGDSVPDNLVG